MFEYTLLHWVTFISAAALLSLSPGPDMAYILAQTARNGQRAGFAAMLGIWAGAFIHVLFAAAGLSAILATSATAFSLIKWIGAVYLVWLGVQAIRSAGGDVNAASPVNPVSNYTIFRQGTLVATLNPKVAIFFLAFLPQFVVSGAGPVGAQLFLHGCLVIVVAAFIEPPIVIVGAKLANRLSQGRVPAYFDRCLGVLFVGLGVRLAFTEQ